jgi:hypothetical protein
MSGMNSFLPEIEAFQGLECADGNQGTEMEFWGGKWRKKYQRAIHSNRLTRFASNRFTAALKKAQQIAHYTPVGFAADKLNADGNQENLFGYTPLNMEVKPSGMEFWNWGRVGKGVRSIGSKGLGLAAGFLPPGAAAAASLIAEKLTDKVQQAQTPEAANQLVSTVAPTLSGRAKQDAITAVQAANNPVTAQAVAAELMKHNADVQAQGRLGGIVSSKKFALYAGIAASVILIVIVLVVALRKK